MKQVLAPRLLLNCFRRRCIHCVSAYTKCTLISSVRACESYIWNKNVYYSRSAYYTLFKINSVFIQMLCFKATEANLGHIKQILGIRYKELKNLLQRI